MDELLDQLDDSLRRMHAEHEQLLALVQRKKQAIASAQSDLVQDCCQRENVHVQQIAELEKQRQLQVGQLTAAWEPNAAEPLRLTDIAERCEEPRRGQLLVRQQQLRELMQQIKDENAVAKQATESLLGHVKGVMRMVADAVAGSGVYGSDGATQTGPAEVASSFAVTA